MTRPALRPLTMATAVVVAGAAGVVPATAAGAPLAPRDAEHSSAPHHHHPRALLSPAALPAQVGATVTRGPGAPQTGLAASSVTVAGGGTARWERGTDLATGRSAVGVVRVRGPPV
ncbi:MAG TPA: hypothetical protein VH834_03450 [Solirubrobacteraceae bacterium]